MILKHFRNLGALLLFACAPALANHGQGDAALLAAFDAYRAGDAVKLAKQARTLNGHVLAPWTEYWQLALRLEDAHAAEVGAFLQKHSGTYVAERLRMDWLRVLGKRGDWQAFDPEYAQLARNDLELRCYAWTSRATRGDDAALEEASAMWLEPRELPEGCAAFASLMIERGRIGVPDIWRRVRVLFENGQIVAAKNALGYLPKGEGPEERSLAEAGRQPQRLLPPPPENTEAPAAREAGGGGGGGGEVGGGGRRDRSRVGRRAPRSRVDLLVRPRPRRAGRERRRQGVLPAHRRAHRFLQPARHRGAGLCRRDSGGRARAGRRGSRGREPPAGAP